MLIATADLNNARNQINYMLARGVQELDRMERFLAERYSVHDQERRATYVVAYLLAANALLDSVPELHKEMIEKPEFMRLRALQRQYMG